MKIIPDLPDLREEIAAHQVVVLPFVSGGGIKNKLLEAAAMGKAVVCTRAGLRGPARVGGNHAAAGGFPAVNGCEN